MNYYKFNIGDYAAATRHLTMVEHGAYRLLIDLYYTSEQPIPLDLKAAARKAGARSKEEVQAVEAVLSEFFTQTESGWTHKRCETEIAVYQQKAETNRVIGMRGGRPKKETQTVSDGNPQETQMVSKNNPNQEPRTINHKPKEKNTSEPPEGVSPEVWRDFLKTRKTKLTETALAGIRAEAEKAGITLNAALATSCARGWQSFRADWLKQPTQPVNKQTAIEQRNKAVVDSWLQKQEVSNANV